MQCVICKNGITNRGNTTVTLNRDEATIVFKDVPAEICENCGEYYLDDETTALLLEKAEQAVKNGAVLEIQKFAA
jgi:YgiT-type zinc finger domain-containing protein